MPLALSFILLAVFAFGYPLARWGVQLRRPTLQSLGTVYGLGLLVGLTLGLLTPTIRALVWLAPVLVLVCIWSVMRDVRRDGRDFWRGLDEQGSWIVAVAVVCLTLKVLSEWIEGWDARSIWYFHAKAVFYADHILDAKLWSTPAMSWAHVDYPKLNAFWAAALMTPFGVWNEFLPKFSLILLVVPALCFCVGFSTKLVTRALLLALFVLRIQGWLWNGYMDGILAIYAGLGCLYGMRYVLQGVRLDLLSVLTIAGICAGLKNEGLVLGALILGFCLAGRWLEQRRAYRPSREVAVVAGAAFFPVLIWSIWKGIAGIANDLTSATKPWVRLSARLADGHSARDIWKGLFPPDDALVLNLLAGIAVVFWLQNWRRAPGQKWAMLTIVGIIASYVAVLVLIYLTTPFDLEWHLATSVERTRLALHACLAVALVGGVAIANDQEGQET